MPANFRKLTIDASQCGPADSTNFPLTIAVTDLKLKDVAHGGLVQSASGYDIRPFSNAALTVALPYELVSYAPTTGAVELHVKLPTLSHTTNTVIYLGFNDASLTTDGSSRTTWDSNFLGVWHFGNGSTLSLADSSQSATTGTNHGATAAAGQVGGALSAGVGALAEAPHTLAMDTITTAFTMEAWFKPANLTQTARWIWGHSSAHRSNAIWSMAWEQSNNNVEFYGTPYNFGLFSSGPSSALAAPDANWHHYAYTFNGTAWKRYLDGVLIGTGAVAASAMTAAFAEDSITFGSLIWEINTSTDPVTGWLDEARVSNVVRGDSWFKAQYNNQRTQTGTGDFITYGPVGYVLSAGSATVTTTGTAAGLRVARGVSALSGSYLCTGTAATLRATRRLAADAATYTVTGTAAALSCGRSVTVESGVYTVTGTAATLRALRILHAGAGAYTWTGAAAWLRVANPQTADLVSTVFQIQTTVSVTMAVHVTEAMTAER